MNTLADYTSAELIIPQLRSRDAEAAIAELCSAMQRHGAISELLPFYHSILSREMVCSTAHEPCWALPHGRLAGLPNLVFALGRCPEPLPWFSQKGVQVQIIFLFAVPENQAADYLTIVSALARLNREAISSSGLLLAPDRETLFRILANTPLGRKPAAPGSRTLKTTSAAPAAR